MAPPPAVRTLLHYHPHLELPAIISGPVRPYALAPLATTVSQAGGLGFISSTPRDRRELAAAARVFADAPLPTRPTTLAHDQPVAPLPIGIGYLCWMTALDSALADLAAHPVAAVWLYAWRDAAELQRWVAGVRRTLPDVVLWVQVCSVAAACEVLELLGVDVSAAATLGRGPRVVLVAQGSDAGGHGAVQAASLLGLLPELVDAVGHAVPIVAAGGIADGRGATAALALGAAGVVMGTRFLASAESANPRGFKAHLVAARDGGLCTVRTRLFDTMRGTAAFPAYYDARALRNRSLEEQAEGVSEAELTERYRAAEARSIAAAATAAGDAGAGGSTEPDETWGEDGRLTTYAGTVVGLVHAVLPAAEIVRQTRAGVYARIDGLEREMRIS